MNVFDTHRQIVAVPVAVWLENRIALEERDGQLARRMPMRFNDVVAALAEDSGAPEDSCQRSLEATLQWVSAVNQRIQEGGSRYTLLPFKLHQFIAQTGSVYTTLDQGEERFITLEPGLYKHDDRHKPIFANVFSRATGHPFICVSLADGHLVPREFRAAGDDEENATDGYLIIGDEIWNPAEDLDYLPEAWVRTRANGEKVPDSKKRARFPRKLYFDEHGHCSGTEPMRYWGWFMQAPLLFDPTGGVFYDAKTNEGTKLTRLGSEGRSTSTHATPKSSCRSSTARSSTTRRIKLRAAALSTSEIGRLSERRGSLRHSQSLRRRLSPTGLLRIESATAKSGGSMQSIDPALREVSVTSPTASSPPHTPST